MPSFDIVSEIDMHELSNSIDQANREITNRFDFKGTNSRVELKENIITLVAPAEFQIKQIEDILTTKMSKRGIDIKCLEKGEVTENINEAKKAITVRQGIDKELAKKLVKLVKDTKLKVQSSIQGEQVRVTGKKRDDLQEVIQMLKNSKLDFPLQFTNFRD
ncbi:MAG TPA: YajQ family cyclic di-GMP-binding protein [Gammaproteobacteria bacterium]